MAINNTEKPTNAANESNYSTDSNQRVDTSSRHESMCCADDELNDDECGDKSATLKANGNYSLFSNGEFGAPSAASNSTTTTMTTHYEKAMNRFSSDKSIYYSSVNVFLFFSQASVFDYSVLLTLVSRFPLRLGGFG